MYRNTKGMTEEQRKQELHEFVNGSLDPLTAAATKRILDELFDSSDFYRAPASTKYHGAYEGGLFDHSMNVAKQLLSFTKFGVCEPWQSSRSPILIGLLHDYTKLGAYLHVQDMNPVERELDDFFIYNPYAQKLSSIHGEDSVKKLMAGVERFNLPAFTGEELECIRFHMGSYETGDWNMYDKAIRKFPNVLWTHTADMYASKLMEE